jgi:hypothetical protein
MNHMILAASVIFTIASSFAAGAQTPAPATTNPPGITQGPWTSGNPGSSRSQCNPGEYVVGMEVEVEGAPAATKRCVGCVSRLRVICQRYGI